MIMNEQFYGYGQQIAEEPQDYNDYPDDDDECEQLDVPSERADCCIIYYLLKTYVIVRSGYTYKQAHAVVDRAKRVCKGKYAVLLHG